ncbi:MAG: protein kinase [Lentisphaerae bacterium]|jgi:hypothetical protein|nr:protein kinase [Lentisphaerota bacterium]MBT4818667.1 protein kinase [Lentisphaerota bacterium]MBT5610195.1 protein kinase [Lentisphaerota bacterium]MBT7057072.1 protein kinase [Lentisphaerota bacterium]MBT7846205.1 protein kinase [Lentisphaerota bacterium]
MIVPFECSSCGKAVQNERVPDANRAVCPECGSQETVALGVVPGVTIGRGYRLDELVTASSGGDVYRGCQVAMQRDVVVKILPDMMADEEQFGRFVRGAKLTASLQHPSILGALDAGEDCGVHFLVTEYRDGVHLGEYLKQQGDRLPEKEALRLLIPIAEGLQHAWDSQKIIHRNIKPENILVTQDQGTALMDLGIAKSLGADAVDLTGADYTVGTPEYMSPEQVTGEDDTDFAADLYSLGIVLYRMVVGALPFEDSNPVAVMDMQMSSVPVPARERNPDVSKACSGLIDKMLAKERSQRHESWAALIREMRGVVSGKAGRKARASAAQRAALASQLSREGASAGAAGAKGASSGGSNLLLYVVCAIIPIILVPVLILAALRAKEGGKIEAAPTSALPAAAASAPAGGEAPQAPGAAAIQALQKRVAGTLVADGPVAAVTEFTKVIVTEEFAGATETLRAFQTELGATLKQDDLILASFIGQVGQDVTIRLKQDGELKLRIKSVEEGRIKADRSVRSEDGQSGGTLGMTFTVADLHPREAVKRIRASEEPRAYLLCGLIALEANSAEAAVGFLRRDGGELAKLLVEKLTTK